jgi:hypothetical protein
MVSCRLLDHELILLKIEATISNVEMCKKLGRGWRFDPEVIGHAR